MILMAMTAAAVMGTADVNGVLDGLDGHCWAADFGGGTTDTHCFKVLEQGRLGTDTHIVTGPDGKASYEGVTVYQVTASGTQAVYYNSLGDALTWMVERAGDTLSFRGAPDVTWHVSADNYSVATPAGPRVYQKVP